MPMNNVEHKGKWACFSTIVGAIDTYIPCAETSRHRKRRTVGGYVGSTVVGC